MIYIQLMSSFFTSYFGIKSGDVSVKVTITNKLKGNYRYFYEPSFRLTIPFKSGADAFHLVNVEKQYNYPVKLEYGEEIQIDYPLNERQLEMWNTLDSKCEVYAVCATTIGEKFESNRRPIKEVIDALNSFWA